MAYDLFEIAGEQLKSLKPFVLYRKPSSKQLRLIVQSNTDVHRVRSFKERGFIMAPFNPDELPLYLKPDNIFFDDHYIPTPFYQGEIPSEKSGDKSRNAHVALVSKALKKIVSGPLNKVVVSRVIEVPLKANPLQKFNNLLLEHSKAFCYFWYHPATGIWMGATPELFLSMKNNLITIYSLAGTKVTSDESPPLWTDKEKEEQRYVTDFIMEELTSVQLVPTASEPISIRAGQLWHLQTEIQARLAGNSLKSLISSLHPTPAVCGTPKENAIAFIQKYEDYNRRYYTGYLGEINLGNSGECDLFVNLRCMAWSDGVARVYVGGGITQHSIPEEEWQETAQKSTTITGALFNSFE